MSIIQFPVYPSRSILCMYKHTHISIPPPIILLRCQLGLMKQAGGGVRRRAVLVEAPGAESFCA